MSECTIKAQCSDEEYQAAQAAGLLVVSVEDERTIHAFAESIRAPLAEKVRALSAAARAGFEREDRLKAKGGGGADIPFRLRIARLLAELHGEGILSEQQCASYMRIDLVSWRKLEDCFSAGTSFVEGEDSDLPAEDSESVLRAAIQQQAPA